MKKLEEALAHAKEQWEMEEKRRKEAEEELLKAAKERDELAQRLETDGAAMADIQERADAILKVRQCFFLVLKYVGMAGGIFAFVWN